MMMFSLGELNTSVLKNKYKKDILDILTLYIGSKTIIWDNLLIGPFGLIIDYAAFKENNVNHMFQITDENITLNTDHHILFILKPIVKNVLYIHNLINGATAKKEFNQSQLHIIWIPKNNNFCEQKLKDLGIYTHFNSIHNIPINFFPLDNDIASLELSFATKDVFSEDCPLTLYNNTKSLWTLLNIYGDFVSSFYVISKGLFAKQMHHLLKETWTSNTSTTHSSLKFKDDLSDSNTILILLDRTTDLLTPFLSQLTYEGFIDEAIGIKYSGIKLPSKDNLKDISTADNAQGISTNPPKTLDPTLAGRSIILNSSDEIFHETRDKSYNAVGHYLSQKAKNLSTQFEERFQAKTVSEVKNFVKKLPLLQNLRSLLSIHTTLAELIKEYMDQDFRQTLKTEQEFLLSIDTDKANPYIEDCIAKHESLNKVLRLICVQSFVNNGLKPKLMEHYFRYILQTYGYEQLTLLRQLQTCKIITDSTKVTKTGYDTLVKTYNLIIEKTDEKFPLDFSYVHSIYAPLSVRIIQQMITAINPKDTTGYENAKNKILGAGHPNTDLNLPDQRYSPKQGSKKSFQASFLAGDSQASLDEENKFETDSDSLSSKSGVCGSRGNNHQNIIVFMVGGITYSEISALRFLFKQDETSLNYMIITSNIINGNTMIDNLKQDYPF